jgi:hypothetical protein
VSIWDLILKPKKTYGNVMKRNYNFANATKNPFSGKEKGKFVVRINHNEKSSSSTNTYVITNPEKQKTDPSAMLAKP